VPAVIRLLSAQKSKQRRKSIKRLKAMPGQGYRFPAIDERVQQDDSITAEAKIQKQKQGSNRPSGELLELLELKIGARVVLTRNLNVDRGLVNGALGQVEAINGKYITVLFSDGERELLTRVSQKIPLPNSEWMLLRKQFPMELAFAVNCFIYKQGLTVDNALIYLDDTFFEVGQAYVALTRVTSLQGLHLAAFNPKAIMTNPRVTAYLNTMRPLLIRSSSQIDNLLADLDFK